MATTLRSNATDAKFSAGTEDGRGPAERFGWDFWARSLSLKFLGKNYRTTVEEIRRSPVEVGSLFHYFQGFSTIPGG